MFRAVSFILWGNENRHKHLRSMVVNHIRSAWPEVKSFVLAEWNITRADRYVEFMGNEGTFASELECIVAAKLNQLNLAIYRRIGPNAQLQRILYSHFSSRVKTGNLLFSGRNDYGHYDVLLPI
ncbi:uncharacterized protein LOC106652371 [Trichogramma pretiosum]|uniref:uncharacterized protein LOC106652371 n=1 Tax=Trichogramma pretiosum TaxID=7493 RepID=UPI0006C986E5|nr:uncharacterized protein LOC106652371 [Trichogramma pretiosum]